VTLATSVNALSVGDRIFAFSPLIDFSAGASGAERTALDFTSPNFFYECLVTNSIDSGSWSDADIIAFLYRGNGQLIYKSKHAVNASTLGQDQASNDLRFVLPPNTVFRASIAFSSSTAMVGTGSVVLTGKVILE